MLRNCKEKLRASLTIRIFLITALILAAACGVTYGFIAWATPITYTSILTSELNQQAQALAEELQGTTVDTYEQTITSFERKTGTIVDILTVNSDSILSGTASAKSIDTTDSGNIQTEQIEENDTVTIAQIQDIQTNADINAATSVTFPFAFTGSDAEYLLTVTRSVQAVNQTQHAIRQVFPYLLVVIMLIALLGALIYSRYITKPVVRLSGISQKMSELDFTWRCDEKRVDEIGALGHNLNTLSQRLSTALNELQDANNALRRDIDRERELEQQRMTFFSAASHELKTPITILRGQLSGMLAGVDVYQDRDKYLARSLTVANRMQSLVQEILTVAQMENAEFAMRKDSVNLSTLVTELTGQAVDLAEQRSQTLTVEIAPAQNICGDAMLLERAISNLLGNALFHSPEGATIQVCLTSMPSGPCLLIDNNGVCISESALPHLFEAFYRADTSRSRETGGSGLGLYLVQMILERHHAVCTIENTQHGVRTMVTF